MTESFDAAPTLAHLTEFQRATVNHVMDRFFGDDATRRFLTADETGLGKSLVASGVIASLIERLQHDDSIDRVDIVYVCSNADIAEQNLERLNVTGEKHLPFASRLTLLAKESHRLTGRAIAGLKAVNLVSFTPGTSFEKGHTGGRAEERALLYLLLRDLLRLDRREQRRAKILLRHRKAGDRFDETIVALERHVDRYGEFDPVIVTAFAREARSRRVLQRFRRMVNAIGQRQQLRDDEWEACRALIGALREALAKASIDCLEPDLIILDEFQRFRHLLDKEHGGPAAELAHDLFEHSDARVLLLSATPYKPFTYSEERIDGEDHQRDFFATLRFLASDGGQELTTIRDHFDGLRSAAVTGADPTPLTAALRAGLLRFMCRTERPQFGAPQMLAETPLVPDHLAAQDLLDLAAVRSLARDLDAPFALEYWKSAPYFINFSDGYRLGSRLRQALATPIEAREIAACLAHTRRIDREAVESGEAFDPGNARLRSLLGETADAGWWQLLWMPPSLPYLEPAAPYAGLGGGSITKRLVFSSWAATPTAVAAILSHHAQRHTAEHERSGPGRARRARLEFRVEEGRPGAMTTLALFWPNAALAALTDPLTAAFEHAEGPRSPDEVSSASAEGLSDVIGHDGDARGTASEAWYWLAPFRLRGAVPEGLRSDSHHLTLALTGALPAVYRQDEDEAAQSDSQRLRVHVELAADASSVIAPEQRPRDLLRSVSQIGLHAPGNISWRALGRQLSPGHTVTPEGHWSAAATIASGFRSLFNRPDVAMLLDGLYPDAIYWRAVLTYCAAGNLQAVVDEYLHHLAGARGPEPLDDGALLQLAAAVRDALAMRPAPYTAFDPSKPEEPIVFSARFALRYGNKRQTEGDVRQPLVRNAFNSPFWPFVLATTSVGQEGIDLHWWCHAVVHWNTPASPVDFDQREGRVHRYGGHAIRKNVAAAHRIDMLAPGTRDPWAAGYEAATELQGELGDLSPHWVYPGPASIRRITMPYPLSVDHERLRRLKDEVALYRLTLGQPRQEDMVDLLRRQGVQADPQQAARLRLDLTPPRAR